MSHGCWAATGLETHAWPPPAAVAPAWPEAAAAAPAAPPSMPFMYSTPTTTRATPATAPRTPPTMAPVLSGAASGWPFEVAAFPAWSTPGCAVEAAGVVVADGAAGDDVGDGVLAAVVEGEGEGVGEVEGVGEGDAVGL